MKDLFVIEKIRVMDALMPKTALRLAKRKSFNLMMIKAFFVLDFSWFEEKKYLVNNIIMSISIGL